MPRIYLIHWNNEERNARIRELKQAGFEVVSDLPSGPNFAKHVEESAPGAILIDLSCLPSQGRDLGVMMRSRKGTRSIPILFIEGVPEKMAAIQALLPDAVYTTWKEILLAIKKAMDSQDRDFMAKESVFAAYAGTPLPKKLGIKPGNRVAILSAPDHLAELLDPLPANATLVYEVDPGADLYLWFPRSIEELNTQLPLILSHVKHAPTWIAWPKKAAGIESDLNQPTVRQIAMAAGMVDYKICSIDERWSAMLFSWRGLQK